MRIRSLAIGVVLLVASSAHAQQAVQWKVADGGNGHWYQIRRNPLGAQHWPFTDAQASAAAQGANLAIFSSVGESAALYALLNCSGTVGTASVWVGLTQDHSASDYSEPAGGWRWVDGRPLTFNPWLSSEPSNACGWQPNAPQDWGAWVSWSTNGRLDDMGDPSSNCSDIVQYAVFEWSADCDNDGIVDYGQCRDGSLPDNNGNNTPDCCENGQDCVVGNYPVQWRSDDGGNGHWYQRHVQGRTWIAAQASAELIGGHLATPTSALENLFIFGISGGLGNTWLGGRQTPGACEPGCDWSWVTGEPWTYANWRFNQPDNTGGSEDHLCYWGIEGGIALWNDGNGAITAAPFTIEWSADCNNDGIVDKGQILLGQLQDTNNNGIPDPCEVPICRDADIYRDLNVNGADLGILLSQWGPNTPLTESDLNKDGAVDGLDLGLLLSFWGPCP